jgi:hypothetical protein
VIRAIIVFLLSNYSLSFLLLGFLAALVAIGRLQSWRRARSCGARH